VSEQLTDTASVSPFLPPPPRRPPSSPLFPYTTLFRSPLTDLLEYRPGVGRERFAEVEPHQAREPPGVLDVERLVEVVRFAQELRSEEHTSELQSLRHLVCRLLLEKKKRDHEPPAHHVP